MDILQSLSRGMMDAQGVSRKRGFGQIGASEPDTEIIPDFDVMQPPNSGIANPPPTRKPCMLPKRQKVVDEQKRQEEEEGIGEPGWKCKMCRVGKLCGLGLEKNMCDRVSPHLQEFYNKYHNMKAFYPKDEIWDTMAKYWNATIFRIDQGLQCVWDVPRMTLADVRFHMKYHFPSNDDDDLDDRLRFLGDSLHYLEDNGIYEATYVDGVMAEEIPIEMNSSKLRDWLQLSKRYEELKKLKLAAEKHRLEMSIKVANQNNGGGGSISRATAKMESL
jgi:hypothetical protein